VTTVDCTSWVSPGLVITLGGHTYEVRPPSVAQARAILACVVRSEVSLGLVEGPLDPAIQATLDELADTPLGVHTLGRAVYEEMAADEVPEVDIDRMAYYALHYWARGKVRADFIAEHLWGEQSGGGGEPAPKGRSRSRTGRRTASASQTRTGSTRTTASPSS
jgi:hypothetical protein